MAVSAKINLKNMDYFKFRKYVIDGNRDETSACSKEVASLCACVQTLNLRDDEFDPGGQDWPRFDEICSGYRQILQGKRVESLDVKIKSGWWGEQKSGLSAGKVKASLLQEVLVAKTKDWMARNGETASKSDATPLEKSIEGAGVYVFKHKERPCFQLVQSAKNIFQKCSEFLKSSFDGSLSSPLTALFVVSLVADWDFYFVPVNATDSEEIIRVLENDLILKHDSIWPHGLNMALTLLTTFDLIQFRRSCVRHRWPPERDFKGARKPGRLDVDEVRNENLRMFSVVSPTASCGASGSPDGPLTPPSPPAAVAAVVNERPSSARTPSNRVQHPPSAVQPKTPRPSTAKVQNEPKKTDSAKLNAKSTAKSSMTEINKSHSSQSIKKEEVKRDESAKKIKSKENKSPDSNNRQSTSRNFKEAPPRSPRSPPPPPPPPQPQPHPHPHPNVSCSKNKSEEMSAASNATNNNVVNNNDDDDDDEDIAPPSAEEFVPQPLKRSNTFTYEDDEQQDDEGKKMSSKKSEAIARFVAAQTN